MAKLAPDKRSFTLSIKKTTYEQLEKIARAEIRSVTYIINELLEEALVARGH